MSEYIRVRQIETGHQLSVPRSHAEATGGYEVLDKPAVDSAGRPLPPKYRVTLTTSQQPSGQAGGIDGYAAMTVKQLKAEIAARNDRRDSENQLSASGNKAALVAVLDQDDATQTPAAPAADSQPPTTPTDPGGPTADAPTKE